MHLLIKRYGLYSYITSILQRLNNNKRLPLQLHIDLSISADIRLKEHRDSLAVISSNGDVLWIPMAILKVCYL